MMSISNHISYLRGKTCHFSSIQLNSHSRIIFHSLTDLSFGLLILQVSPFSTASKAKDHCNKLCLIIYQSILVSLWNIGVVCGNQNIIHAQRLSLLRQKLRSPPLKVQISFSRSLYSNPNFLAINSFSGP